MPWNYSISRQRKLAYARNILRSNRRTRYVPRPRYQSRQIRPYPRRRYGKLPLRYKRHRKPHRGVHSRGFNYHRSIRPTYSWKSRAFFNPYWATKGKRRVFLKRNLRHRVTRAARVIPYTSKAYKKRLSDSQRGGKKKARIRYGVGTKRSGYRRQIGRGGTNKAQRQGTLIPSVTEKVTPNLKAEGNKLAKRIQPYAETIGEILSWLAPEGHVPLELAQHLA